MSKVLVTGGAGFIGSHVVDALVVRGEHVRVLDSLVSGTEANLLQHRSSIDFILGDIRDAAVVASSVAGCDYVIHLAAFTSAPESIREEAITKEVNVTGTEIVLAAANEAGVSHLVGASSAAVYGHLEAAAAITETDPVSPISPYGFSKLENERQGDRYTDKGLSSTWMRFFNVYGPRQLADGQYATVIPRWIHAAHRGVVPVMYGDGSQTRDFVYVTDVVSAVMTALYMGLPGVFNVGSGHAASIVELAELIEMAHGAPLQFTREPKREGDIARSVASTSKLEAASDWRPVVSLTQGLATTYRAYCAPMTAS